MTGVLLKKRRQREALSWLSYTNRHGPQPPCVDDGLGWQANRELL